MILSETTEIPNMGDCIFINKPSQLEKYVERKRMNKVISIRGTLGASETKDLKKELGYSISSLHNVIHKKGHYTQVTNMDNFIIYWSAI